MIKVNEDRPDWQKLELLVASIQRQLAPGAKVTHNAKVEGRLSETSRQIDVLVEQLVGQYQIRIALDCKDYKTPVDVKAVEEFHGLMVDIGAHRGALVCPVGFTKSAKKRAKKLEVELFSPADTDPHKWQVSLALPAICDFRATRIAFGISTSAPMPMRMPERFYDLSVLDANGKNLGRIFEVASNRWDEGEYPTEPGAHEKVPLLPAGGTTVENGYGSQIPVDLTVSLLVTRQRYFGHIPITELHGLRDEQTGTVITNAFRIKLLDPVEVQNQWVKLAEGEEAPTPVALEVVGLHCWGPK
jgi:Restriction endonuclease